MKNKLFYLLLLIITIVPFKEVSANYIGNKKYDISDYEFIFDEDYYLSNSDSNDYYYGETFTKKYKINWDNTYEEIEVIEPIYNKEIFQNLSITYKDDKAAIQKCNYSWNEDIEDYDIINCKNITDYIFTSELVLDRKSIYNPLKYANYFTLTDGNLFGIINSDGDFIVPMDNYLKDDDVYYGEAKYGFIYAKYINNKYIFTVVDFDGKVIDTFDGNVIESFASIDLDDVYVNKSQIFSLSYLGEQDGLNYYSLVFRGSNVDSIVFTSDASKCYEYTDTRNHFERFDVADKHYFKSYIINDIVSLEIRDFDNNVIISNASNYENIYLYINEFVYDFGFVSITSKTDPKVTSLYDKDFNFITSVTNTDYIKLLVSPINPSYLANGNYIFCFYNSFSGYFKDIKVSVRDLVNTNIYGNIVDQDKKTLTDVKVELHSNPIISSVDKSGKFYLLNAIEGNHTLFLKDNSENILSTLEIELQVGDKTELDGNLIKFKEGIKGIKLNLEYNNETNKMSIISLEEMLEPTNPNTNDNIKLFIALGIISGLIVIVLVTYIIISNKKRKF